MRSLLLLSVAIAAAACSDTTAPDSGRLLSGASSDTRFESSSQGIKVPKTTGIIAPGAKAPETPVIPWPPGPTSKFEPNLGTKAPQTTGIKVPQGPNGKFEPNLGTKAPQTTGIKVPEPPSAE